MSESKNVTMHDEMQSMEYEPLNEMEMKLIKWSLGLGITLLVVFFLLAQVIE